MAIAYRGDLPPNGLDGLVWDVRVAVANHLVSVADRIVGLAQHINPERTNMEERLRATHHIGPVIQEIAAHAETQGQIRGHTAGYSIGFREGRAAGLAEVNQEQTATDIDAPHTIFEQAMQALRGFFR